MPSKPEARAPDKPRKPPRKPRRAVAIIEPPTPDTDGWCAIKIAVGKESAFYLLHPMPADFGEGCQLEKLDERLETVEAYDVNLMGQESICTCLGHNHHGHCKHVDGLQALDGKGLLPRLKQKHHACPLCLDRCDGGQLCDRCAAEEEAFAGYHQACEMEAGGCTDGPSTTECD